MATATMATMAGVAALLYYTLVRKSLHANNGDENEESNSSTGAKSKRTVKKRVAVRQAPATWLKTTSTLSETLRFTYSETLGKWPIGDLAFGIHSLKKTDSDQPMIGEVFKKMETCACHATKMA